MERLCMVDEFNVGQLHEETPMVHSNELRTTFTSMP